MLHNLKTVLHLQIAALEKTLWAIEEVLGVEGHEPSRGAVQAVTKTVFQTVERMEGTLKAPRKAVSQHQLSQHQRGGGGSLIRRTPMAAQGWKAMMGLTRRGAMEEEGAEAKEDGHEYYPRGGYRDNEDNENNQGMEEYEEESRGEAGAVHGERGMEWERRRRQGWLSEVDPQPSSASTALASAGSIPNFQSPPPLPLSSSMHSGRGQHRRQARPRQSPSESRSDSLDPSSLPDNSMDSDVVSSASHSARKSFSRRPSATRSAIRDSESRPSQEACGLDSGSPADSQASQASYSPDVFYLDHDDPDGATTADWDTMFPAVSDTAEITPQRPLGDRTSSASAQSSSYRDASGVPSSADKWRDFEQELQHTERMLNQSQQHPTIQQYLQSLGAPSTRLTVSSSSPSSLGPASSGSARPRHPPPPVPPAFASQMSSRLQLSADMSSLNRLREDPFSMPLSARSGAQFSHRNNHNHYSNSQSKSNIAIETEGLSEAIEFLSP